MNEDLKSSAANDGRFMRVRPENPWAVMMRLGVVLLLVTIAWVGYAHWSELPTHTAADAPSQCPFWARLQRMNNIRSEAPCVR